MQTLAALLTPAIAALAIVIAYMQWRTAHQKVVMDLFEKRMQVYRDARNAVAKVVTSGRPDQDADIALLEAIDQATFLFGDDVQSYLKGLWESFSKLHAAGDEVRDGNPAAAEVKWKHFRDVDKFYRAAPALFAPYLRMDQKLTRTPAQWFRDRNRIRLSYADKTEVTQPTRSTVK